METGLGNSDVKVQWNVMWCGTCTGGNKLAVVPGSEGSNNVSVEVDANTAANVNFAMDLGNATVASAKFSAVRPTQLGIVNLGFASKAAKTGLDVASNASGLDVDISGGTPFGRDELIYSINQTVPAPVNIDWQLDTGAEIAGDLIDAKINNSGGTVTHTGSILTRGGDDVVLLETSAFGTSTGLLMNGGPQNDTLSQVIQGRFLASPTLPTRMLGADGNDTLVIRTDTGIFGSGGIDLFPIVNCGAGVDSFNAFGQISGCEARFQG